MALDPAAMHLRSAEAKHWMKIKVEPQKKSPTQKQSAGQRSVFAK